ncbi:MAG: putative zinc-binding protein [Promethearchaeota archaeon]
MSRERVLLVPCSGVERATGQVSSLAAAALAQRDPEKFALEPSLAQMASNPDERASVGDLVTVALDGCGKKCASKLLSTLGFGVAGVVSVPKLLKGSGFSPSNPKFLVEGEKERAAALHDRLAELVDQLLASRQDVAAEAGVVESFSPTYDDCLKHVKAKFVFRVPVGDGRLYYSWNDAWLYVERDDLAFVGITDYLQQNVGDVTAAELPRVGDHVEAFDPLAAVETIKTAIDVLAPATGTVVAVNVNLLEEPERINQSPHGAGWVCALRPDDLESELENLMDAREYFEFMKQKVDEEAQKN